MTTLRTAAQQALEALEMCRLNGSQYLYGNERDLVFSAIKALRAALAQEQPTGCERCKSPLFVGARCSACGRVTEQAKAWVCPEAPEERAYPKPGHCENCGKTLVPQERPELCRDQVQRVRDEPAEREDRRAG